jgi:hypothetical protein
MALGSAAVVVALLAGCSSTADELRQNRTDAIAAIGGAAAMTRLYHAGRAPLPLVATQYGDALRELTSAEQSLEQLSPEPGTAKDRARLLGRVRGAIDALLRAQRAVDDGREPSTSELRQAREQLR